MQAARIPHSRSSGFEQLFNEKSAAQCHTLPGREW
nr:MAG TPA: hypothetical protein [Caudoviricetes sp.]